MKSDRQPLICVVLTLSCTAILVLFTDVERDLMRQLCCNTIVTFSRTPSDACD